MRRFSRILAGALFLLYLSSCSVRARPVCTSAAPEREAFITYQSWHRGVVIPVTAEAKVLIPEINDFPDATFVEIGWGDRDFYMGRKTGVGAGIAALFFSAGSVIHVFGFNAPPRRQFEKTQISAVLLGQADYLKLVQFIGSQFDRPAGGKTYTLGPGLYDGSRFYPARGKFSLSKNCHHWVMDAFRQAGCVS